LLQNERLLHLFELRCLHRLASSQQGSQKAEYSDPNRTDFARADQAARIAIITDFMQPSQIKNDRNIMAPRGGSTG